MDIAVAFWAEPAAVVWVDLPHRRLQGFDNYWVDGSRYGVWNDPSNMATVYEGRSAFAWEFGPEGEVVIDPVVPPGAATFRGVMLTADQAAFVGLI